MNLKNKLGLSVGGALILALAACGGGDGSPFNLGSASSDGSISSTEAGTLVGSSTETGEPDDVSNLMLATSETDEPFDLPD
jgi:hypothetical protein